MAGSELKTTISIVDEASKVLDDIANASLKASIQMDKIVGETNALSSGAMPKAINASKQLEMSFESAFKAPGNEVSDGLLNVSSSADIAGKSASGLIDKFVAFSGKAMPALYTVESAIKGIQKALSGAIDVIERGDDIAKTSRALHINAQTYQELSYALQRGGATQEEFSSGIKSLNRQISALKQGSTEAREAFGLLGIDAADIKSQSLEQTLYSISDALHSMDNAEDVDKVMQTLLGRGSYKLVSAFSVGGDELKRLQEQARKTGSIMNSAQTDLAEKGADDLLDVQLRIQSVWQNIALGILPTVVPIMDKVTEIFDKHGESLRKISDLVSRITGVAISGMFDIADKILEIILPAVDVIVESLSSVLDLFGSISGLSKKTLSGKSSKQAEGIVLNANNNAKMLNGSIEKVVAGIDKLSLSVEQQGLGLAEFIKKQNARNNVLSFSDFAGQKIDEALGNGRITEAERLAKSSMDAEKWDELGLSGQLGKIKEYYNELSETGINDYKSLEAAKDNVKQLDGIIETQTAISERTTREYQNVTNELNAITERLRTIREQTGGVLSGSYIDVWNGLKAQQESLTNKQTAINEAYSRAFIAAEEAKDERDKYLVNISNAESQIARYNAETAKNTRKVSINRDDMLFMRSMTTAEVINRYNNISDSIAINNNYASTPSNAKASGLTSAMLQGAVNALRAG